MKIVGIDPGKTTGWAVITVENKKITLGKFGTTKDLSLLEIKPILADADVVAYEGFWIRPGKAEQGHFNWSQMQTPQVIGSIRTLCGELGIQTKEQQPSQKVPGYAFAGMKYVKGKQGTHWQDALAHAVFYAVRQLQAHPVGTT
jgi:hypothetical protein